MRTGITGPAHATASASVVLTAAVICAGAASADPSPSQQELQDYFVTQLAADQIPVVDNLPALVARAHEICSELDHGASVYAVVDEEMKGMFEQNPEYRQMSGRVHRTAVRFIATSIQVYCPSHFYDPYITNDAGFSIRGPAAGVRHQAPPTRIGAAWMPHSMDGGVFASGCYAANRSDGDAHGKVLSWRIEAIPSGDITQPDPPQVPPQPDPPQVAPPPPPRAQIQTPRPVAPPPLPKRPPPPPRQEPPAVGPQPGDAAGSGGGGGTDGGGNGGGSARGNGVGGPAGPSPAPPTPPGLVGLAP
ncbi:DUF732 domain-containing protein [Mycobacterium parmense]|uniref:DUF732 domain-containing protein n=1 Tax=Mycobacterium parmense TaxID=185642 RepID=A0A7I7YU69_9MYCO|nr:DUF732 domain-containing protein [Mycobacterium parmense]MCV7351708.1 DUF732 domain-containing protein [Mycobacterium parmense]BBZ44827.1 hypothetical protein MPRM_21080 [Mycobacterium parmense]